MPESKPVAVDVDPDAKPTPLEPGPPVEAPALSQMGATFAERAAARKKAEKRAVSGDDAENKAVSSSESKTHGARKKP
jgi:hypothetical protein